MSEWVKRKLGEIGDFVKGSGISRAESNTGTLPAVRYGELYTHHNDYVKKYVSYISEVVARQSRITKRGDILFTCSGETTEDIGKAVAVLDDGVYAGGDLLVYTLHEKGDPIFWGSLMNAPYVQSQKSNAGHGATVIHINESALRDVEVSYPKDIHEQRRIAEVLADADALIANTEKRIAKRKLIKQGMMQQLLTGAVRLPSFTGEWEAHRLADVADFVTGTVSTDAIRKDEYVGTENMKPNCMGVDKNLADVPYTSVREYRIGDVLLSNIRPYLKKCWLSTRNGGCSNDVIVVRGHSDMVMPEFLYGVLSQDAFFKYVMEAVVGTKMPRGDKKVIAQYGLRLPPALAEQRAIAAVLTDMDSEIAVLEKKVEKYRRLKSGMMSELLTGKVRLSEGK